MNRILSEKFFKTITIVFIFTFLMWISGEYQAYAAKSAAMVLSASGDVQAKSADGSMRKLTEMSSVYDGETVVTGKNGKVTLVLFSNNAEYSVGSSSSAIVTTGNVAKKSGDLNVAGAETSVKVPTDSEIYSNKILGEVSRIMKDENLFLYPGKDSRVISGPVTFRWSLDPVPDKVEFLLKDEESGEELLVEELSGNHYTLPASLGRLLKPGGEYTAELHPIDNSANSNLSLSGVAITVDFGVLTQEQAEVVESNRKAMEAELAEDADNYIPMMKMMYVYLDNEMFSEVVELGERMQGIMPENPNIYHFMGYAFKRMGMKWSSNNVTQKANELERKL